MPSQITSILAVGGVDRWTAALGVTSTQIGVAQAGTMGICRREVGSSSGTQAAYHLHFMNNPCGSARSMRRTSDSIGFPNRGKCRVCACKRPYGRLFDPATFAGSGTPFDGIIIIPPGGTYDFFYENSFMWNNACAGNCLAAMKLIGDEIGTDDALAIMPHPVTSFALDNIGPIGNVNDYYAPGNPFPVSCRIRNGNSCLVPPALCM